MDFSYRLLLFILLINLYGFIIVHRVRGSALLSILPTLPAASAVSVCLCVCMIVFAGSTVLVVAVIFHVTLVFLTSLFSLLFYPLSLNRPSGRAQCIACPCKR